MSFTYCVTWCSRNFVVPAKAGTQWRIRAKDAGFGLRGNDAALQIVIESADTQWNLAPALKALEFHATY
jgi:hypothetical protein